ncbi:hypothetical protein FA15DRAFT_547669, partial [Coprinopsis marcescibilis]
RQKLTEVEEKTLVQFILESADRGFPLRHREIIQYANLLLQTRNGPSYEPVGVSWVS